MSDTKPTMNRRVLLGQLAYSLAGAVVLGPTMSKCMRDEWMAVSMDLIESTRDTLPENLPDHKIEQGLNDYYEQNIHPTTKRLTTALGGMIGYFSANAVEKPMPEPDIY